MNTPTEETNLSVLVKVTREQQIEIEDICFKDGIGISQYFIGLHEADKERKLRTKQTIDVANKTVGIPNKPKFKTPAKIKKSKLVLKGKIKRGKR